MIWPFKKKKEPLPRWGSSVRVKKITRNNGDVQYIVEKFEARGWDFYDWVQYGGPFTELEAAVAAADRVFAIQPKSEEVIIT